MAFNIILLFYMDVFNKKLDRKIEVFKNYVNDIDFITEMNDINIIISKINVIMNLKEKIKFNANSNLLLDKLLIDLESCENND